MNTKLFSFIAFIFFFVMTSCEKDSSNDIIPNNPSNDSITSQPDTVDALHYWKVDNYTENDSITYFFENGSLLTISPDTLYGNTIQIGRMQESGEWSKEDEIFIFTDTLNLPCFVKTIDSYFTLEYFDNNTVSITAYDFDNKEINKKEFSIESIVNNKKTRASAIQTTDIALGIVDLIQFVKNPSSLTNNITALATALGWKTSLDGNTLLGSTIGSAGSLYGLIMNLGSKLAWGSAIVSVSALIDELNNYFRPIWWGENPSFSISSISSKVTTAEISTKIIINGKSKSPSLTASCVPSNGGYSALVSKTIPARNGENQIALNKLYASESYQLGISLRAEGVLGIFGQLTIDSKFSTGIPVCNTGKVTNITNESATINFSFSNIDEGVDTYICFQQVGGQTATIPAKKIEDMQSENFVDLKPLTSYTYYAYALCPTFSSFGVGMPGEFIGEKKTFTTGAPNIDGVWSVTEGDGSSYTITFQNGECSWSKPMKFPNGYNIGVDGSITFGVCIDYVPEQWNMYDNANFTGVLNNKHNPTAITGEVVYIHGNWIGAYGEYKKTTFTATR